MTSPNAIAPQIPVNELNQTALLQFPAVYRLIGHTLPGGWFVTEPLTWKQDPISGLPILDPYSGAPAKHEDTTGGNFSAGYRVEQRDVNGKVIRVAFLKAINLERVKRAPNVMAMMTMLTEAVNFEQLIHKICGDRKMDRVILAIDTGQYSLGSAFEDQVPFLVLELANGDVRREIRNVDSGLQTAWKLRALHHTAVGLKQLHSADIAHQDLKPSNVMRFEGESAFKIGDFGRSVMQGTSVRHDRMSFAGDPTYAPPELMYNHIDPDWTKRRIGCDFYLLGSLIVFFFLGQGTTALLMDKIDISQQPAATRGTWSGTYRDAMPFIRTAFTRVLEEFASQVPKNIRNDLVSLVSLLCDPDPDLRGGTTEQTQARGNRLSLERHISLLDRLSIRAEISARRSRS